MEFLLEESWKQSPLDTIRLIFYIRDCRGGKGEKLIFRASCRWLLRHHLVDLNRNFQHIPFYGSWKDVLQTFLGTSFEGTIVKFYAQQLQSDKKKLGTSDQKTIDIGAAKYAPNESSSFDKSHNIVIKLCNELGVNKAQYRKDYLRPLRSSQIKIVEELMCGGEWEEIDFGQVPSIAFNRYRKAFEKHTPEKFKTFIGDVVKGEKKINVKVLHPHEILNPYLKDPHHHTIDDAIEAQWVQYVKNRCARRAKIASEKGVPPVNALCIVDVSGSMTSSNSKSNVRPLDVAVSMGLLISLLNDKTSPFHKKWITFSKTPIMERFTGGTLSSIIKNIDYSNWTMTTRLQPVFDLILNTATMFKVPPENMPKMLIILSDMQFDSACPNNSQTNWTVIEKKYAKYGYTRPTLIFWNLNANTLDIPIPSDKVPNTALVSGFSPNTFDQLLDGDVPSPFSIMRKTIDNPRYARITVSKETMEKSGSSSSHKA